MSVGPATKAFTVHKTNPQLWMNLLESALPEEWKLLPQDNLRILIRSMPQGIQAVIVARSENTWY